MRRIFTQDRFKIWTLRVVLIHVHLCLVNGWFFGGNNLNQKSIGNKKSNIPSNVKLLILPGFGNDSKDYLFEQFPQGSLVQSLVKRGWERNQIYILPVQRTDWLQVFTNGLFDIQFWQGIASPTRPSFRWYLQRIVDSINEISTTTLANDDDDGSGKTMINGDDNSKVILIGHSAGGWLGRAAIGYGSIGDNANNFDKCIDLNNVCGIVTLGTPNLPPPPTFMDMTRGALKLTSTTFPGAYHNDKLFYLTVIGNAVKGVKKEGTTPFERTKITGFAYNSYEAVCGDGEQFGDGVVPLVSGHLDGAVQITLSGIFHSINAPDKWYGSDAVIDDWHQEMLIQLANRRIPSLPSFRRTF